MEKGLLEKFRKGQCTPEELQTVLKWLHSGEAADTFSEEIGTYWKEELTPGSPFSGKEEVYERILEEIAQKSGPYAIKQPDFRPEQERSSVFENTFRHYRSMAAVLLLLIVAGSVFFGVKIRSAPPVALFFPSSAKEESIAKAESIESIKWVEKQSLKGQKITIRLPDGTMVKLNSGSTIKYPASFTGGTRTVWLEGEGFFDVTKDADKPFIIRSGAIFTTVLGTSFNIRAFPEDDEYKIAVVTGKVVVGSLENGSRRQEVTLIPKEAAVYQKSSKQLKQLPQEDLNTTEMLGWKDNILTFDNASLEDVFRELENWYGVEIEVRSGKDFRHGFTGTYKDEDLETILKGIGYVMGFDFEIKGKQVIIN